jgi:muramoyltetrapeptide carboxypeptidase
MMDRSRFLRMFGLGSAALPFLGAPYRGSKKEKYASLTRPKRLKPGDRVALTAPAGIVFEETDFERMQSELESFGFEVVFGEYVRERHGYFAGTDRQRAEDLNRFFWDPSIDGILAVRGGWGCARILPFIDFEGISHNPKVYCGFSDNTTLHMAMLENCGLVTFHGPNGNSEWTDLTRSSFRKVIMEGETPVYESNSSVKTLVPGTADGHLIGGNLTILTTTLGTEYQPDTDGAILFVEDIGEPVYKIDRMLTHLRKAGLLNRISGFMFGGCTNCPQTGGANFRVEEILMDHLGPLGIPVISGVDISHDPDNFTVPQGLMARLDADSGTFELLEQAVV